jgi:hypothetical protein
MHEYLAAPIVHGGHGAGGGLPAMLEGPAAAFVHS